jgi:hypothetical protein
MAQKPKLLGVIKCTCGEEAEVREAASGLAYSVCDWCNVQTFTRSKRSDKNLRERMTAVTSDPPAPAAKPKPTPAQKPKPAPKPTEGDDHDDDESLWG